MEIMEIMEIMLFLKDSAKIISYLSSYFENLVTGIFTEHFRVAACQDLTKT